MQWPPDHNVPVLICLSFVRQVTLQSCLWSPRVAEKGSHAEVEALIASCQAQLHEAPAVSLADVERVTPADLASVMRRATSGAGGTFDASVKRVVIGKVRDLRKEHVPSCTMMGCSAPVEALGFGVWGLGFSKMVLDALRFGFSERMLDGVNKAGDEAGFYYKASPMTREPPISCFAQRLGTQIVAVWGPIASTVCQATWQDHQPGDGERLRGSAAEL